MAEQGEKAACRNCYFYNDGYCFRRAPTLSPGDKWRETRWPQVLMDQWCGEHERKLAPELEHLMEYPIPSGTP